MIDINELRKRKIVSQIGDITGDSASSNPVNMQQQSTGPTFPDTGIMNLRAQSALRDPSTVDTENEGITELWKQLQNIYSPETTSRDRYNELLGQFPERNKPGIGRKLVASGMGLDARNRKQDPIKTMESVMYAPYERSLDEWKEKTEPYYKSAQLENTANINERTLAGNILTADTAAKREALRYKTAEEKNEIALIRANAYRAKSEGAEIKIEEGNVVAYWPTTGRVEFLGKVPGTSTDAELANIRGKYQVEAARQRGADALQRTTLSNTETYTIDGKLYTLDPSTNTLRPVQGNPGGTVNKVGTPNSTSKPTTLELNRQRQDRMRNLYETDPNARKYFTRDSAGRFVLVPRPTLGADRSGWFTGNVDQAELDAWDEIKKEIDPEYTPTQPETPVEQKKDTTFQQAPIPPYPGAVMVERVDGVKGWVPQSKLEEKLATGQYRRVQ